MKHSNIKRELYLTRIRPYARKDLIKVLIGQRRVGKSYILRQVWELLIEEFNVIPESIIYISKEQRKFDFISNSHDLLDYIELQHKKNELVTVLIDEIQEIKDFERALRELQSAGNYDIYCTGSNSDMLSSDLATLLSGRYIEIAIHPLGFTEFLQFHNLEVNKTSLLKFFKYGGLPYLKHLELDDEIIYGYLQSVYNTIILKDVVERFSIRNVDFLHRLVLFLADNTGAILSASNISDYLKSQRINISVNVILNYLSHLTSAFFVKPVRRLNINGKKIFSVGEKFYFNDLGLKHVIHPYQQATDINKILENVVYNHLIRLGYTIYVGIQGNREIDFICQKGNITKYIQVTYLISSDKVAKREFGNLLAIKDNYEKYVISADEFIGGNRDGIEHLSIMDFLLDDEF